VTEAAHAHHQLDFSLVRGGPFYQLLERIKLLRAPTGLVKRRVIACIAVTLLPLVVLTALSGTLVSGVAIPLVLDLDVTVKFLFALPLMIAAEPIVHDRVKETVQEYLDRDLIAPRDEPRFEAIVASTMRLRNSAAIEVILFVVALTGGYALWSSAVAIRDVPTWYSGKGAAGLTTAGWWYAIVSQSIARFIMFRWYFRLFVWYVLMWRVSRLRLQLNPLHPDRAGGLAFLSHTVTAFSPVLVAQSSFVAAMIGNHIWHEGAKLPAFKFQIAGLVAFLTLQSIVPLLFFSVQLVKARLATYYEMGRLAVRYTGAFRDKWLEGAPPRDEALLGTADLQSLADLANSFEVVRTTRPMPFDLRMIVRLVAVIALPLLPLALTMVPLDELLRGVLKIVM